jgi:hypothetical protein
MLMKKKGEYAGDDDSLLDGAQLPLKKSWISGLKGAEKTVEVSF